LAIDCSGQAFQLFQGAGPTSHQQQHLHRQ